MGVAAGHRQLLVGNRRQYLRVLVYACLISRIAAASGDRALTPISDIDLLRVDRSDWGYLTFAAFNDA